MVTQKQRDNLKDGDKLICVSNQGLYAKRGFVFTFSNWKDNFDPGGKHYFQSKELFELGDNFKDHNFGIYDFELFDPHIHLEFIIVTKKDLLGFRDEFVKKYGE